MQSAPHSWQWSSEAGPWVRVRVRVRVRNWVWVRVWAHLEEDEVSDGGGGAAVHGPAPPGAHHVLHRAQAAGLGAVGRAEYQSFQPRPALLTALE